MDDHRFITQPEPDEPDKPKGETVDLGELEMVKLKPDALVIDLPDGSISINFGGLGLPPNPEEANDHDANLAMYLGSGELTAVSDELLRLIQDDTTRQEQRLQDAIRSGVSPEGIRSFERSVSEYRSRLSLAQSRKASDYYNMNSD